MGWRVQHVEALSGLCPSTSTAHVHPWLHNLLPLLVGLDLLAASSHLLDNG
jgi:hypothetical protein